MAEHNPLSQFEITPWVPLHIGGIDISFTNSACTMIVCVVLICLWLIGSMRSRALVPGRAQGAAELSYQFVAGMVKDAVGSEGRRYFPFIFSVFIFILFSNMMGMVPYVFTTTSHIVVTFAMATLIFLGVTVIALIRHKHAFFSFFLPHGTPWWLAPLMIIIELFAYLARPVSLSIRLAANMTAGHVLLKVIAAFVVAMGVWGFIPIPFIVVLTAFEIFIAILQAYIFTILTCVYLNDAIHLH